MGRLTPLKQRPITALRRKGQLIVPKRVPAPGLPPDQGAGFTVTLRGPSACGVVTWSNFPILPEWGTDGFVTFSWTLDGQRHEIEHRDTVAGIQDGLTFAFVTLESDPPDLVRTYTNIRAVPSLGDSQAPYDPLPEYCVLPNAREVS